MLTRDVRYKSTPAPETLLWFLALVYSAYSSSQLVYSAIYYPPTTSTIVKLLFFLAVFAFSGFELIVWFRKRNAVAFKIGPAGIWTKKVGWLEWRQIKLDVSKRFVIIVTTFNTGSKAYHILCEVKKVDIRGDELLELAHLYAE